MTSSHRSSSAAGAVNGIVGAQPEIPVWFESRKKWVTGITKQTSVNDVIFALLRHALAQQQPGIDSKKECPGIREYRLVCTMNGHRTILKGRTKMYKLWKSWISTQVQVTLVIHHVDALNISSQNRTHHQSQQQPGLLSRILGRKVAKDNCDEGDIRGNSLDHRGSSSTHECIGTVVEQDKIIANQNDKIRLLNRGISEAEAALEKAGVFETDLLNSKHDELKQMVHSVFEPSDSAELDGLTYYIRRFLAISDQCAHKYTELQQCGGGVVIGTTDHQDALSTTDANLRDQVYASREITRRQCKQIHDLELEIRDCDNALARKKNEIRQIEHGFMAGALNQLLDGFDSDSSDPDDNKLIKPGNKEIKTTETDSGVNSMSSTEDCQQICTKNHVETLV